MKKLFLLMCAALFLVGLGFGEASAVRLEFGGYYGGNPTTNTLTGFFQWTSPGSGGVTTGTGVNLYTTYSNTTGLYHMQWGSTTLDGTVMDARVFTDYSRNDYDRFQIATNSNPDFGGYPRFQMTFTNKIGNTLRDTLLDVVNDALPAAMNLRANPGGTYGQQTNYTGEYTLIEAFYYASRNQSTAFSINMARIVPDGGAPVPEPATMLLLGTGLIGLAGFGRRKLFKRR